MIFQNKIYRLYWTKIIKTVLKSTDPPATPVNPFRHRFYNEINRRKAIELRLATRFLYHPINIAYSRTLD